MFYSIAHIPRTPVSNSIVPKVCVVIPSHERSQELVEAIESVLHQDYKNIDVLVAYTPRANIQGVIEKYKSTVIFIQDEFLDPLSNPISVKRNAAITQCTGDYVAFLDDDDVWHPHKVSMQVGVLQAQPGVIGCCTRVKYFSASCVHSERNSVTDFPRLRLLTTEEVVLASEIHTSSMMVRRKVFDQALFPLPADWKGVEDYWMWLNLLRYGKIVKIDEPLCYYRLTPQSVSRNNRALQLARALSVLAEWTEHLRVSKSCLLRLFLTSCLGITRRPYDEGIDCFLSKVLDGRILGRAETILWILFRVLWKTRLVSWLLGPRYDRFFRKRSYV